MELLNYIIHKSRSLMSKYHICSHIDYFSKSQGLGNKVYQLESLQSLILLVWQYPNHPVLKFQNLRSKIDLQIWCLCELSLSRAIFSTLLKFSKYISILFLLLFRDYFLCRFWSSIANPLPPHTPSPSKEFLHSK